MNGVSLLVALATVGVDVGWESSNGQSVFTIRIENLALPKLRDGLAVESPIKKDDQGIRDFRVVMGPRTQRQRSSTSTANEVTYGWAPNENYPNEIDYYVQIGPERLETLAQGIPIDCQVHRDVPTVHRIFVFKGVAVLPRQLPAIYQTAASTTQPTRATDQAVQPAANTQPNTGSRFETPAFEDPRFVGGAGSQAGGSIGDSSQSSAQRVRGSDQGWKEDTRRETTPVYGPEPPNTYRTQQNAIADERYRTRGGLLDVPGADRTRAGNSASTPYRYQDEQYPSGRYVDDRYPDERYAARTEAARQPTTAGPANDPRLQPPAQQSSPNDQTTKQLVELVQAQQDMFKEALKQQQANAATSQMLATGLNNNGQTQSTTSATESADSSEGLRTPLVVTMFALFASLCANAYIGWLAWSFFWRFRNAASDLARAQTAATLRQAA